MDRLNGVNDVLILEQSLSKCEKNPQESQIRIVGRTAFTSLIWFASGDATIFRHLLFEEILEKLNTVVNGDLRIKPPF